MKRDILDSSIQHPCIAGQPPHLEGDLHLFRNQGKGLGFSDNLRKL